MARKPGQRQGAAERKPGPLDDLLDLTEGMDLADVERRARAMTAAARARLAMADLKDREARMKGEDDRLDAAGEQRLRDDLYRRLVALAADLGRKGDHGCAGSGRSGTDPDGLEPVVARGPETA